MMARKRKHRIIRDTDDRYLRHLSKVSTIREVATMWGVSCQTVQDWINQGYIAAEKMGNVWVVALDSVVSFKGAVRTSETNSA